MDLFGYSLDKDYLLKNRFLKIRGLEKAKSQLDFKKSVPYYRIGY